MEQNDTRIIKAVKNAKDITESTLEGKNDVFADIVNVFIYDGEQEIAESELEQATTRSIYKADGKLREQERDVAKYWRGVNFRIALLGIENQTESEDDVPLRMIGYDGASYRDQLFYEKDEKGQRRKNKNPRYPAVTLLLYFGYKKHWDKALSLYESLGEIPEKLKPYVNDYKVNLFEVAWLTEEQVERFQTDFRIVADYFVQMRKNHDYVPSKQQMVHAQEVLQIMAVLTQDTRFEEAYHNVEEGEKPKNMCEVLDRVENRGIEKGIEKGELRWRILEYIDIRREDNYPEGDIKQGIMKKFGLTEEQAESYMLGEVPNT